MKSAKKTLSLILALCLILSMFVGCGSTTENPNSTDSEVTDTTTEQTWEFTMAHHHAVGSLTDQYCNDFVAAVAEKTGGKVKITVYPGAQLGTEQEAADGILLGTQQFTVVSPGSYVDNVPGFGIETLPFMARGWEELWYVFNEGGVGEALDKNLNAAGGKVLGWLPTGGRHMIFVDKNVTSYKDIAGLNMRCPESTIFSGMMRALGASPTPITWSDCYSALQTKVVDGMETPIASMVDMNFAEVSKYCLLTNHMWSVLSLVVNYDIWNSLPADVQDQISEAADEVTVKNYAVQQEAEVSGKQKCLDMGIVFNEMNPDEAAELPGVFDEMKAEWVKGLDGRQEIYDLFNAARDAFAKK